MTQLLEADVFINKLEAARRQLDAAIRMTFANEDELAIHTVGAAAYSVLRDMLKARGRHDSEDLVRAGIHRLAHSLVRGEMSDAEIEDLKRHHDKAYALVLLVANDIRVRGADVTPDDVPLSMHQSDKTADRKSMSIAANFLKHADKDSDALLPLERVDNDTLLMRACSAYWSVSHAPTTEMVIYLIFWSLIPGNGLDLTGEQAEIAEHLGKLNPHRRRLECARIIRKIK